MHLLSDFLVSTTAVSSTSVCRSSAFVAQKHTRAALILHLWTKFLSEMASGASNPSALVDTRPHLVPNHIHSSMPTPTADLDTDFWSGPPAVMCRSRHLSSYIHPYTQSTITYMLGYTCSTGFATTWSTLRSQYAVPTGQSQI